MIRNQFSLGGGGRGVGKRAGGGVEMVGLVTGYTLFVLWKKTIEWIENKFD